jgi:hypothetical protein
VFSPSLEGHIKVLRDRYNNESRVFTTCQKFDWVWETKKCVQIVGSAIFLRQNLDWVRGKRIN